MKKPNSLQYLRFKNIKKYGPDADFIHF